MAIQVLKGEKQLLQMNESVEGKRNELVLTDAAVYIEVERSALTTWLLGLFLSLFQIVGITAMFGYLKLVHNMVYIPVEQIDHISVSRAPKAFLVTLALLALIVLYAAGPFLPPIDIGIPPAVGAAVGMNPLVFAAAIVLSLIFIILLIVWPRSQIVVGAGVGHFVYGSNKSPKELMKVLAAIQGARRSRQTSSSLGV